MDTRHWRKRLRMSRCKVYGENAFTSKPSMSLAFRYAEYLTLHKGFSYAMIALSEKQQMVFALQEVLMRGRMPFVVVAFAVVALVSVVVFTEGYRANGATGATSTAAALATNNPTIVALTTAFAEKQIPITTQQAVNSTIKAGVRSFTPVGGTLPPTSNAQTQTAVAKPLPTCTTSNTPPPIAFPTAVPGNANDSKFRTAQAQGATAINAPADERHVARQTTDLAP